MSASTAERECRRCKEHRRRLRHRISEIARLLKVANPLRQTVDRLARLKRKAVQP